MEKSTDVATEKDQDHCLDHARSLGTLSIKASSLSTSSSWEKESPAHDLNFFFADFASKNFFCDDDDDDGGGGIDCRRSKAGQRPVVSPLTPHSAVAAEDDWAEAVVSRRRRRRRRPPASLEARTALPSFAISPSASDDDGYCQRVEAMGRYVRSLRMKARALRMLHNISRDRRESDYGERDGDRAAAVDEDDNEEEDLDNFAAELRARLERVERLADRAEVEVEATA